MSFQQGLSGLNVSSRSLDIISNNVANTNTAGFKNGSAVFADVYAASLSGTVSDKQVGAGGTLSAVRQTFAQGNLTTTNNPLDLAINGNGFFIIARDNGPSAYTRNGQFDLDKDGYVITSTGERLMGYQSIPDAGSRLPNEIGGLKQLQIPNVSSAPVATSKVTVAGNLDAEALSPTEAYPLLAPFPGATDWRDARTYNYSTSIQGFDSLGKSHEMTFYFVKQPESTALNTWDVFASFDGAKPDTTPLLTLKFTTSGRLDTASPASVTWNVDPAQTPDAAQISSVLDLTGMTQTGGTFLINDIKQDGRRAGELASLSVDQSGLIVGSYTNGQTYNLGRVALATFRNANGLNSLGNNLWEATSKSGPAFENGPGEGLNGVISSSTIEESNVELTQELVQMIIQQRNYQANAQSIKTQDAILQTLVNLR
ncbi:MAG: flagellar hook protein FlgE [Proteobacteria bacterium]|nr:flagellar hook protein FlgE [Pseudomonadota bacterium]MBS0555261.1 flagellar hook protein FlgE [Pseudomonadota bacterium]